MKLRRRWGIVEEIAAAAQGRAAQLTTGHRLELDIEKELPAVRVDSSAVAEVIYSLLDNATKYAPEGTTILLRAHRGPKDMIEFAVEDEGPGIPLAARKHVFDKFFHTQQPARSGRPAGAGLGLAIARGIVEAHGGNIWVEDGPAGKGARIAFTVPIGDDDEPPENGLEPVTAIVNHE